MKKPSLYSIISKLFICFLLMIIPIMAAGIAMFMWEKQTIKSQIEEAALDNVSFLRSDLENEIDNITMLQYNLSSDTTINKLATQYDSLPNYEYYTLINDVQRRLKIVKNSNNYIEDVVIFIAGMGYSISTSDSYLEMDEMEYEIFLDDYWQAKYPLTIDEQIYSTSIYPVSANKDNAPIYLVKVILTVDKLQDFLSKFSKYNQSDTALYDYTSGNWIFSTQGELADTEAARLDSITDLEGESFNAAAKINGQTYYVVSVFSEYLNASFVQYVPMEEIFREPDRYGYFLWIYAALSLIIMSVYWYIAHRLVQNPIDIMLEAFRRVEQGNLETRIHLNNSGEFSDLSEGFNKMTSRLGQLIDKVYKQELYAKKTELKQLQSQINPHFLYNSYFILHRMIKERDMENAQALSSYIGNYFQYITRNANQTVSLENEWEHARSYINIQQMRFHKWLTIEFGDIPQEYLKFPVPRIILQPIIENSLEHGLKSVSESGLIRVNFIGMDSGISIVVEDRGNISSEEIEALSQKLDFTDDGLQTTGIINVHRRIILQYRSGSGISLSRSELGGLRVELKFIPQGSEKGSGHV